MHPSRVRVRFNSSSRQTHQPGEPAIQTTRTVHVPVAEARCHGRARGQAGFRLRAPAITRVGAKASNEKDYAQLGLLRDFQFGTRHFPCRGTSLSPQNRRHRQARQHHPRRTLFGTASAQNRQAFHAAFRKEFWVLLAADAERGASPAKPIRLHVLISRPTDARTSGCEVLTAWFRERFPNVRHVLVTPPMPTCEAIVDALNHGGAMLLSRNPGRAVRRAVRPPLGNSLAEEGARRSPRSSSRSNRQLEFALRQRLLS